MRYPTAAALLNGWEQGLGEAPAIRAAALLRAACPEIPPTAWEAMSIGERDARLLELRAALFGPRLEAVAACPACCQPVEIDLSTEQLLLRATEAGNSEDAVVPEPPAVLALAQEPFDIEFRLPNSGDLGAVSQCQGAEAARALLLERCLISVKENGQPAEFACLPPRIIDAVNERMGGADAQAELLFGLECPGCGHGWQQQLDIGAFLWEELSGHIVRLLDDVHVLASAYGWPEREILALSPWRRNVYRERVLR